MGKSIVFPRSLRENRSQIGRYKPGKGKIFTDMSLEERERLLKRQEAINAIPPEYKLRLGINN